MPDTTMGATTATREGSPTDRNPMSNIERTKYVGLPVIDSLEDRLRI